MKTVVIYGFRGKYIGNAEYEYSAPEPGAEYKCMLFLSQSNSEADYEYALSECRKYGFGDVEVTGAGPLQVEVLSTDQFRGFAGFYEEAITNGSALVYYLNA